MQLNTREENALLHEHDARIRMLANGFTACGIPIDDLVQEARIAFLQAVRAWRSDGGASLWTFARIRVLGVLADISKGEERRAFDSSGEAFEQPSAEPSPEEQYATKERLRGLAFEMLTPIETEALRLSAVSELGETAIGERLGVHPHSARRIVARAKRRAAGGS